MNTIPRLPTGARQVGASSARRPGGGRGFAVPTTASARAAATSQNNSNGIGGGGGGGGGGGSQKERYAFDGSMADGLALSGLRAAVRYTLPRVPVNMSISGTIAAMHGYAQPAKQQSANREGSVAAYTCMAQREPSVGVANRNTEVICAGMTSGAIVLWRFPKTQRVGNLPPPPHTIAPPLILGVHRAAVTALAFFDDTILVSGSHDCCLCLWDVNMQFIATEAPGFKAGSRCVQSVVAHNATVSHVAVHGPWIVSAGSTDGTIKVWGCAPGREKLSFPFIVPLQVILLESRITALYCGELRAVEAVVPDLIVATADGNATMFRSTEEALIAQSTGTLASAGKEHTPVLRVAKQIRTHYPEGAAAPLAGGNAPVDMADDAGGGGGGGLSARSGTRGNATSKRNNNNAKKAGFSSWGGGSLGNATAPGGGGGGGGGHDGGGGGGDSALGVGSLTSVVPLPELNTIMTLGYSANCHARDSLNFAVMNALVHPDVNPAAPGNPVRFVHCAYDAKKEELLLIDSRGEILIWSTKSAKIVFRTSVVVGAFAAMFAGDRGFWVIGSRDVHLIRIEREEHRLEHPVHSERIVFVGLAPPREWWTLFAPPLPPAPPNPHDTMQMMHLQQQHHQTTTATATSLPLLAAAGYAAPPGPPQHTTTMRSDESNSADETESASHHHQLRTQVDDITPWIVTASVDNTICVWNAQMKRMHTMREKRSEIASFSFLWTQPGFVVSGHEDGSVKVWALTAAASRAMSAVAAIPASAPTASDAGGAHQQQPRSARGGAGDGAGSGSAAAALQQQQQQAAAAAAAASLIPGANVTSAVASQYVSAGEAFSHDTSSNAFHFKAHTNTVSVVGEGLHRRNPYDPSRYERHPHLFSASYDGTLAVWSMPCIGGARLKCEARVKCSQAEIISGVYDPTQYCYWIGTNRGEVTAWSVDDLRPLRRLAAPPPPPAPPAMVSGAAGGAGGGGGGGRADAPHRRRSDVFLSSSMHENDDVSSASFFHVGHAPSKPLITLPGINDHRGNNRTMHQQRNNASVHSVIADAGSAGKLTGVAHTEAATALSLDANYIFTGAEDGTSRMWNGVTGELHHALRYDAQGKRMLDGIVPESARRRARKPRSSSSSSATNNKSRHRKRGDDDGGDGDGSSGSSSSDDDDAAARMAGDVHHLFIVPSTGQIVVGTRHGIVTIFDQATGLATAIGTTNKGDRNPELAAQAARQQAAIASASGGDLTATLPTIAAMLARGGRHGKANPQAAAAAAVAAKRAASALGGGDDDDDADNFSDNVAREVCCLALCTVKQELIAGLGNGSIVRLALSALKPVPSAVSQSLQYAQAADTGAFLDLAAALAA